MQTVELEAGHTVLEELAYIGAKLRNVATDSVRLDQPGGLGHETISEIGEISDCFDESFNGLESRHLWRFLLVPPASGAPLRGPRGVPSEILFELREALGALLGAVDLLRQPDLERIDRDCLSEVFDDQTVRLKTSIVSLLRFVHSKRPRARR